MNQNHEIGNEYQDLIRQAEASRRYRRAFVVALSAAIIFALGIVALSWRLSMNSTAAEHQGASGMPSMPASSSESRSSGTMPMQSEAPLNPIQLSPQRMQSIGVQIGKVQSKIVSDELRFYGNVQPNERRLAYVQTRFAGWIRQVFVDATGDSVRKGQPLFTIYSPDLVSSEQEYLLAKKNAAALGQSQIGGVASGAGSLFTSAKARLQQWNIPASEIEKLDRTGEPITNLTINSPVSGYVIEKNALPNMYVQPDTRLYTVADLSEIWSSRRYSRTMPARSSPAIPPKSWLTRIRGKPLRGVSITSFRKSTWQRGRSPFVLYFRTPV